MESRYQARLITKLKRLFPGCIVLKNDSGYMQGIPDLTVFYRDRWAMLEVKDSISSPVQANQEYYVGLLNQMSYASFVCPENEREVLHELQRAFQPIRSTRIPIR